MEYAPLVACHISFWCFWWDTVSMPNRVRVLTVCDGDRVELARRVRAKGSPAREVERARIVLLAAEGVPGKPVSYTHLRAHETRHDLVCRLLLEKKKTKTHIADI